MFGCLRKMGLAHLIFQQNVALLNDSKLLHASFLDEEFRRLYLALYSFNFIQKPSEMGYLSCLQSKYIQ